MLKALKEEVGRARYPAFFRDAAQLEAGAVGLCVYAALAAPGLLQTEEYARAVFRMQRPVLDDDVIEHRLAARMVRQEIFTRRPAPLLSFIIEEVVLRKPIGGIAVLRGQLEQILLVGQNRNVEIQVMPTGREDHAGLGGPFNLIDTAEGSASRTPRYRTTAASTPAPERSVSSKLDMAFSGHRHSPRVSR